MEGFEPSRTDFPLTIIFLEPVSQKHAPDCNFILESALRTVINSMQQINILQVLQMAKAAICINMEYFVLEHSTLHFFLCVDHLSWS